MGKETEITVDTLEDMKEMIRSQEGEFIIRVEFGEGDGGDGRKGQP